MIVAALVFGFVGFAALALAMPRHHRELFGKAPSARLGLGLRAGGVAAIAIAIGALVAVHGLSIGFVEGIGLLTPGALAVSFLLTYRSTWWRQ